MTHAEAIAALDLIVHRADQTVPSPKGFKWIFVRANELADAQAALVALDKHKEAPQPS